ncbi:MAG TPA: VanZ family protein [Thioploca sp.]|nr:MAG: VanZ family protein [Gammaproteobacteria bacterium]HDN26766.1 VanZ family protein [Thioploca sp.]
MKENLQPLLRFRKLWLGIGWSLVIAVIVLSLMSSPPMIPSIDYGDKISHVVAYLVLMGWFAQIYHAPRLRLYYMIGFILLGILLEILQGLGGIRQMDWVDMLANSIGVLVAWQLTKTRLAYVLAYFEQKCCG